MGIKGLKLTGRKNMDYMKIAKEIIKNRIYNLNFKYKNFNTNIYKKIDENLQDYIISYMHPYIGQVAMADVYYQLLIGLEEIVKGKYGCNIMFSTTEQSLDITVSRPTLKIELNIEKFANKEKTINKKSEGIQQVKRLNKNDEEYLRNCLEHIDVEKMVKWVNKKMDEEFNKGYDAAVNRYRGY